MDVPCGVLGLMLGYNTATTRPERGYFLDGLGTVFMKLFYEHCGFVLYTQDYFRKTKKERSRNELYES